MSSLGHRIRPIDTESVGNITAAQVIVDSQSAVKELVENSLDAKATSIEVRLKDGGLTLIEVVDNGEGIAPEDYANVAMRHATSKLASFEDLTSVNSFGFRGEALFSMCVSSEKVTITTSTGANGPIGTVLEFDRFGKLVSSDKKVARTRGTTVTVQNVFFASPVRKKEGHRNVKRDMDNILRLMYAYSLVPCTQQNGGVKLVLTNQSSNGRKTTALGNQAKRTSSLRQAVSTLWTSKALENLVELDLEFEVEIAKVLKRRGLDTSSTGSNTVRVRGLISKFSVGCGRSRPDRQFFFVNGRPCDPEKVTKAINSVYKTFNMTQSPLVVADFIIPTDACDINVSPDKRSILLHSEDNLIEALKRALQERFGDARSTFSLNNTQAGPSSSELPLPHGSPQTTPDAEKPAGRPRLRKPVDSGSLDLDEDEDDERAPLDERQVDLAPSRSSTRSSSPELAIHTRKDAIERSGFAKSDSVLRTRMSSPEPHSSSYAGRRSPAHIERIVSAAPSRPSSSRPRDVQMVLDTSGAAWNLRRESAEPPRKRPRLVDEPVLPRSSSFTSSSSNTSRLARAGLRDKLKDFARAGSHVPLDDVGSDGDVDADGDDESVQEGVDVQMGEGDDHGSSSPPIRALQVEPETQTDNSWTQEDQLAGATQMEIDEEPARVSSRPQTPSRFASPPPESAPSGRSSSPLFLTSDNEEDNPVSELKRPIEEREPSPPIDYDMSSDLHVAPAASSRKPTQGDDQEPDAPVASKVLNAPRTQGTAGKAEDAHSSSIVAETELLCIEDGDDVVRTVEESRDVTVPFDLNHLAAFWRTQLSSAMVASDDAAMQSDDLQQEEAGLDNTDDKAAAEALARVLSKDDFAQMEVAGQFNKGFIIARRRKDGLDDLFIIDQHAADEKYNFERLQQTTKLESQRLIDPKTLDLPTADALVAADNLDILRQNGFEVDVDEGKDDDDGARKVILVAMPVSLNGTVFNVHDLEELIHNMRDAPTGTMVRCSKARAMFASRACRTSVMVGRPLTNKQMTMIVRHMVGMDQPWHCPHGRPTMRHLADLSSFSRRRAGVDWSTVQADTD